MGNGGGPKFTCAVPIGNQRGVWMEGFMAETAAWSDYPYRDSLAMTAMFRDHYVRDMRDSPW
jgi:hypothetical protein